MKRNRSHIRKINISKKEAFFVVAAVKSQDRLINCKVTPQRIGHLVTIKYCDSKNDGNLLITE